jgi:hypothetical protein
MDRNTTASFSVTLEKGDYVLICFVPDKDGRSHAAHGMIQKFTIS